MHVDGQVVGEWGRHLARFGGDSAGGENSGKRKGGSWKGSGAITAEVSEGGSDLGPQWKVR